MFNGPVTMILKHVLQRGKCRSQLMLQKIGMQGTDIDK